MAEGGGLLSRYTGNPRIEGSNPSLPAILIPQHFNLPCTLHQPIEAFFVSLRRWCVIQALFLAKLPYIIDFFL